MVSVPSRLPCINIGVRIELTFFYIYYASFSPHDLFSAMDLLLNFVTLTRLSANTHVAISRIIMTLGLGIHFCGAL